MGCEYASPFLSRTNKPCTLFFYLRKLGVKCPDMERKQKGLGPFFRESRNKLDMTLVQLSEILKISPSYLAHIESGRDNPGKKVIYRFADLLKEKRPELLDELAELSDVKLAYNKFFNFVDSYERGSLKLENAIKELSKSATECMPLAQDEKINQIDRTRIFNLLTAVFKVMVSFEDLKK